MGTLTAPNIPTQSRIKPSPLNRLRQTLRRRQPSKPSQNASNASSSPSPSPLQSPSPPQLLTSSSSSTLTSPAVLSISNDKIHTSTQNNTIPSSSSITLTASGVFSVPDGDERIRGLHGNLTSAGTTATGTVPTSTTTIGMKSVKPVKTAKTVKTIKTIKTLLTRLRSSQHPVAASINPTISSATTPPQTPYDTLPSTPINLFGTGIQGELYQLPDGDGVQEFVLLRDAVTLGNFFNLPPASGSSASSPLAGLSAQAELSSLPLTSLKLLYQTSPSPSGIWLSGTLSLQSGPILDNLRTYFGIQAAMVEVRGFLTPQLDWKKPLKIQELRIQGTVTGSKRGFTKVVVAVVISGREVRLELSGDVVMMLPGGAVSMGWGLKEVDGEWRLVVEDREVGDVVGFKGLKLIDLSFLARFPMGKLEDSNFQVSAGFQFGASMLQLRGIFNGDFSLETTIPVCTLSDIQDLYSSITGRQLAPFVQHKVEFHSLVFRVNDSGLTFSGGVTIDGHHSISGCISIKRDGIIITGSLSNIPLGATGLYVENAVVDIFLGRVSGNETSRSSSFAISGVVRFKQLSIKVSVHTRVQKGGVTTVVYGELEGRELGLSLLSPRVKGTWLDVRLSKMAFIYSDIDSPDFLGDTNNPFSYPIRRGVQFCAIIDKRIEVLDIATQQELRGLMLQARYDIAGDSVTFGILLPSPVGIHFSKRVSSGPVAIEVLIPMHDTPKVTVSAMLNVQPPRQIEPLVFTFGINCDFASIKAFGQMENYWINPLGISEAIKIGPHLALQVGYTHFSAGIGPPTVGFSGGLNIGQTACQVAVNISENPSDELISLFLSELSLSDLLSFSSHLHHETQPPIQSEDIFSLRNLNLYLSAGTTIGTKYFPPGASLTGTLTLFSQPTTFEATLGPTTLISASFSLLSLGPITVRGSHTTGSKAATAVIELSPTKQHILLDGCVSILGFQASLHGSFSILPVPSIDFELQVSFGDILRLTLGAKLSGPQHFGSLEGADFMLHAVLEQGVIDYLLRQIRYCFDAVERFILGGIEAVRSFLSDTVSGVEVAIEVATRAFQEAEQRWKEKEAEMMRAFRDAEREFCEQVAGMEEDLFKTRTGVEAAILEARKRLEARRLVRAAEVTAAHSEVLRKRLELEGEVQTRLGSVREVKEKTQRRYGVLEERIRRAEEELGRKQLLFDACNEAYVKALEETSFFSGLPANLELHRMKHVRNDAEAELVTARTVLQELQKVATRGEWVRLKKEKERRKKALAIARSLRDREMEVMEAKERRCTRDAEKDVEYHEFLVQQTEERTAEVEMKIRAVEEYKEIKTPVVEGKRDMWMRVEDEMEFKVKEEKERELQKTKELKIEADAVERVVEKFGALGDKENVKEVQRKKFDIERIELTGSLRALVEKGKPLDAKITVVVNGKRREVVVNWGFGDIAGLVETAAGVIWDIITEKA
ncbi:hypothetical protein BZA77DRAFT_352510 [Pyronema omphalodes]|nr:hypothetical protein BZA77DRAFT_352510 [Pyronema omphalodes]